MSHSKLDRGTIVAEALALLSEEGLANVSQRKIAARLAVTVSSLYWHIRDRDQLLALMCEAVFRDCLDRTGKADDWSGWLRNFGLVLWDKQASLRDCQKLIIVAALDDAVREALQDAVAARLAAYGVGRTRGMLMQMSVQALVTGWSTLDRGHLLSRRDFETALTALLDGWRAQVTPG
jgi:TetR/AcrR family tetracycline transcriptional repressor